MSLTIIGRLHAKFQTQQIKDNFSKREFIMELTDESPTGMVFTNYASFQLVNQSCAVIDQFQEGQEIEVSFNIRGNRWEKEGQVKYITNLNAWRVTAVGGATQQYPPREQQAAPDTFQQPAQGNTYPQSFTDNIPDDLPF